VSDNDFFGGRRRRRGSLEGPAALYTNNEAGVWYDFGDANLTWRRNLLTYTEQFDNAAWTKSNASILSNLALWSQDFDNAVWTKGTDVTVTANTTTAPDGSTTADSMFETANTSTHVLIGSFTHSANIATNAQVRVKPNGRTRVSFYSGGGSDLFGAVFDLVGAGSVVSDLTAGVGALTSRSISALADGWYLLTIAGTRGANTNTSPVVALHQGTGTPTTAAPSYAGDVTKGVFLWGAQFLPGSTAQTYTRSLATAAPILFTAPDGTTTADRLVPDTVNTQHRLDSMNAAVVGGTAYTASVYAKQDGYKYAMLRLRDAVSTTDAVFDLNTGTLFSTNAASWTNLSTSITSVGSGWYRLTLTATAAAAGGTAGTTLFRFNIANPADGTGSAYVGDAINGILVWGAQVEQSSAASTYQRIVTPEITYLADVNPTATLYQDSTGTTPVTAIEQPVGLMIDKSRGGLNALGQTLTFLTTTLTGGAVSNPDGTYTVPSLGQVRFNFDLASLENGATYRVSIPVLSVSGANVGTDLCDVTTVTITPGTTGTFRYYSSRATYDSTFRFVDVSATSGATIVLGAATLNKVSGIHATQSTSANRPTASARVNLLTFSEQFDNAAWSKSNATVTANAATAPDGTTTADKLVENTVTASHALYQTTTTVAGVVYTYSVYIKAAGRSFAQLRYENSGATQFWAVNINLTTGAFTTASFGSPTNTAASVTDVGNGWWRVVISVTSNNTSFLGIIFPQDSLGNNSYTGDGTSGVLVWGADLRVTNVGTDLPVYQRIAASTDYDAAGFPVYLRFNGTSSSMLTGSIPFATWTPDTRRNLLLVPTMFDDAAWVKADVSVTANNVVAPDSTTTGDTVTEAATTAIHRLNQSYTSVVSQVVTTSVYAKATGARRLYINTSVVAGAGALFDLTGAGAVIATSGAAGNLAARIAAVGNGWYRCEVTGTGTGSANNVYFQVNRNTSTTAADDSYLGDGTSGILLWGAQLELGSTATAFQNVGTDKMTVWSGVRKLSDAALVMLTELTIGGVAGSFYILAPTGAGAAKYGWRSYGTLPVDVGTPGGDYPAPITNVLTGIGNISGDVATVRVNGTQVATNSGDQGTGNYATASLNVGARNGASLFFNGQLYALLVRGAASTDQQVTQTETYVNTLTRAY
jgi:hypothetical protein